MTSQKESTTYLYLSDEEPIKYNYVRFHVEAKDTKEEIKMTDKFICSECGEEMDEDCDMCEDCSFAEQEEVENDE